MCIFQHCGLRPSLTLPCVDADLGSSSIAPHLWWSFAFVIQPASAGLRSVIMAREGLTSHWSRLAAARTHRCRMFGVLSLQVGAVVALAYAGWAEPRLSSATRLPPSAGAEPFLAVRTPPTTASSPVAEAPPAVELPLLATESAAPHMLSAGAPAQAGRRLYGVCGRGPFSAGPLQRHKRTQHRRALGSGRSTRRENDGGAPGGALLASGTTAPGNGAYGGHESLCVGAVATSGEDVQQRADDDALGALFSAAGEHVTPPPAPARRTRKRSAAAAALLAEAGPEMWFPTISTRVRAFFERFGDAQRALSLVKLRKRRRPGRFDPHSLRVLEDFALSVGGSGLSVSELNKLLHVLNTWDRTAPGMPEDGDHRTIRDVFNSPNDFRQALKDDMDEGVRKHDWKQCTMKESGQSYEVYFRLALGVLLEAIQSATRMRYWSGGDRVVEASDKRESPFDGDAFRDCEADVVQMHGGKAFVLAFYAYSDSSVLSWSGRTFRVRAWG